MENEIQITPQVYEYIKRKVNLAEFLQTEIGCSLKWLEANTCARTVCPMPNHNEKKASFNLKLMDDVWVYGCFGCGAKGTVIDFFMEYYNLHSSFEAVQMICKKFDFKDIQGIATDTLTEAKKKVDLRKKMELAHIVSSNQCRMLLRKDFEKHKDWISNAYKKMNEALVKGDLEFVENVGFQASKKMGEK
jgi:DNA primase